MLLTDELSVNQDQTETGERISPYNEGRGGDREDEGKGSKILVPY